MSTDKRRKKYFGWGVYLNPLNWSMEFRPLPDGDASDQDDLCVRNLSPRDLLRFGDWDDGATSNQRFNCALCGYWMNGLCLRHPVIFIKEEIPEIIPYHLYDTTPKFLCIKKSKIPGAGRGVFTKIDLPCGVAFGPYSGFLSKTTRARLSGYSWQLLYGGRSQKRKIWIDAYDEHYSNWMALVNSPRFEEEQNMIAMMQSHNMYYYTYKPVPAKTELMVWYGSSYGRYLKIPGAMDVSGSFAPTKEYQAQLSERY